MYFKDIESDRKVSAEHNRLQKVRSAERLAEVAAKVKLKKATSRRDA